MTLSSLGWNDFFANAYQPFSTGNFVPARVALEHKHAYELLSIHGELTAECTGRVLHDASTRSELPSVGDWVVARLRPGERDACSERRPRADIHAVLPRLTKFSRRAGIDRRFRLGSGLGKPIEGCRRLTAMPRTELRAIGTSSQLTTNGALQGHPGEYGRLQAPRLKSEDGTREVLLCLAVEIWDNTPTIRRSPFSMNYTFAVLACFICAITLRLIPAPAAAAAEATVDFTTDPPWEGYRNRLLPETLPLIRQDFGWRAAAKELGGWVQRSVTPATFAKAIPLRTLNDRLSASGNFYVTDAQGGSGLMFGWFNDNSRGWRTPNSLVFRIDGNGGKYWVFYEYGTRGWFTGGAGCFEGEQYQTTPTKPFKADGTKHAWSLNYDPNGGGGNGLMTFTLDGKAYPLPLAPGHKLDGAEFNRFGIINQQITGDGMQAFFSDLLLDGQPIDLGTDPGWIGQGNHAEYPGRVRRPFHDFGWAQSARAGGKPGEIGGIIWRDVKPAYYGAKTTPLTLDDELVASGTFAFHGAASDSGVYLGWFNAETKKDSTVKETQVSRNILAILVEGPSRVGHYFRPEVRTANGSGAAAGEGPVIRPDGKSHRWQLRYAPVTDGSGRVTVTFDGAEQSIILTPEDRRAGATFDRFGIFNLQTGGHFVDIAVDDLRFTNGR
jgi:hypothetical protein